MIMGGWTAQVRRARGRGDQARVARWHGARVGDQSRDLGDLGTDPVVVDLVIDAIAVWRVVRFVQRDTLIEKQREQLINRWGHLKITELLTCPWCLSPYVAAGAVLARHRAPRVWGMIARTLAFSAGAGVITGLVDQLEE